MISGAYTRDQIVTTVVVSYCVIFSVIAEGWGVYANRPAIAIAASR